MSIFRQVAEKVWNVLRPYWRWRRAGLIVAWITALLGWVVVFALPDRFEAMTRIYIETESLLTPLLHNITIQADIQKELEVMQRTLLNRKNIVQVAHAADLDLNVDTEVDKEKLYLWLTRRVNLKAEGHNLFTVTYADTNPKQARKVVEALLNIFVESNLGMNRSGMESARNFIENQISEYEQKLKQADERLADYKSKHADLLSATGSNFSGRLDGVRQDLFAAQARYEDALVSRNQLRTVVDNTPQLLDIDTMPQVTVTTNGAAPPAATASGRVQQLQAELDRLQSLYTNRHPDVVSAKRALDRARAEADQENKLPPNKQGAVDSGHGRISNPVYEQVKLRLVQAETEVAQADNRVQGLTREMTRLQSLAVTAPGIEAELADLNRDYGVLKSKFEELLGRRESARLSQAVEASDDKLHFRIIEPPQVPARPSFPDRPLFYTGVLLLALAIGGAFMVLLQKLDDAVTSAAMLTEVFGLRVIGVVPKIARHRSFRDNLLRHSTLALAGLFLAYAGVLVVNHFVRFADVISITHLPSLLQKVRDYAG